MEISQLATAAKAAYQMLIAVNPTQNTYHMVNTSGFGESTKSGGCFDDLIEFEMKVHPDYRRSLAASLIERL